MTTRELASRIKVPHTTLMGWLQRGRPPLTEEEKAEKKAEAKRSAKKGTQASLFEPPAAKPKARTKKAGVKKVAKKGSAK